MNKIYISHLSFDTILDSVEKTNLQDFINFAKSYNIFQESNSKLYDMVCDKIKARLDREGLDYEIVRPE